MRQLGAITAFTLGKGRPSFSSPARFASLLLKLTRWRFAAPSTADEPLLSPDRIGTDAAGPYPPAITATRKAGLLARTPVHYVTKHLQQGIESDHFRVKKPMPRIGGFQAFHTARRTIQGFEAMLWLRKGFGFAGAWTVREQNRLLALCFGLPQVNKA